MASTDALGATVMRRALSGSDVTLGVQRGDNIRMHDIPERSKRAVRGCVRWPEEISAAAPGPL